MYYRLKPTLEEITVEQVDPQGLTAGYIEYSELTDAIARFGFTDTNAEDCLNEKDNFRNTIEVYENYSFGLVNIVEVHHIFGSSDRLAFFFRRNLLLVVSLRDEDGSTKRIFENSLRRYKPAVVTLERLIFAVLDATFSKDIVELDRVEKSIADMEEMIALDKNSRELEVQIYERKKELLILRSYYEQIIDLSEALEENENEIFEEDALHYFALLTAKATRLSSTVSMLCDELNQLRDAHQSAMDYRLNNTMKLLTVITMVFLPLTLIVGWYGMNFSNMYLPNTVFGYPLLVVICLLIVLGVLRLFHKKGML